MELKFQQIKLYIKCNKYLSTTMHLEMFINKNLNNNISNISKCRILKAHFVSKNYFI